MASKSKFLRKGYGLLSMALSLCLIISMFVMPMTVSAAGTTTPNLIVAQDTFNTLSGWEYTDGIATSTEGKLQLTTGVDSANGTDGYIANVITRPEVSTEQSVTVEVSCDDIAAGKYPAVWLRVQDDGETQKGYVLLATLTDGQLTFGAWWLDTSSATSRTYLTAHRTIAASYFSSTAAGDTFKLTFSAVGTNPTVLTMSSEFVNSGWAIETTYEDSTAAFQASGKVGLSAKSSSAENTIGFDNFVYKSDTVNAVIIDDFSPQTATSLKPEWLTYKSAEDFQIVDEQLQLTVDTGVPSHGYVYRVERPASENAVNQTVSISFTRDQLEAGKMPVLWLRSEPKENGDPTGYYMFWNGSSSISIEAILPDGTSQTIVSAYRTCVSWADKFVYTFSVIDDGETTKVTGTVNHIDTTGDNNYGSWAPSITGTATIPELQRTGAVAISGIEYGGTDETSTLTVDDFVYTTDDFTVTDDFGAGLGAGWTAYPNDSYFSRTDGVMSVSTGKNGTFGDRKLQRPMSEAAVDQFATITTAPATLFNSMAHTILWLRVQNTGEGVPHGYFGYYSNKVLYIGKTDADGTVTNLTSTSWNYANGISNGTYVAIKYNFTAKSNKDGSTTLTFETVPYKSDGTVVTGMIKSISFTDSTAELQKAGTVAVSTYHSNGTTSVIDVKFDNFRYSYPKITADTESVIDVRSIVRLKKYLAGITVTIGAYADYNADGIINADDLVKVRKHLLGSELIGGNLVESEETTGAASAASANLKAEIMTLSDSVTATGTTYYISNDGDDSNSGTSASAPLKTAEAINSLSLKSGDAVLFNRGDIFRTTEMLDVVSGVSYGAYGEGDKPVISGSLKDYANKDLWTSDGNCDLWQTSVDASLIGNIVFDNGKAFGQFKTKLSDVTNNGDYYFDAANKILYLYLIDNNPGKEFESIEIATTETLLYSKGMRTDVTIENLCLKNAAKFAISTVNVSNFTITGCEIGFIGGGYSEENTAYLGNAIEFYDTATNCVVENNYIYQIYDAAVTIQGKGTYGGFNDITFNKNLIENCAMNFEFWISDATTTNTTAVMKNINFTNNIMRFGGYGFGSKVRPTKESFGFLLARDSEYTDGQVENFNVTGNTFDCTKDSFIFATNIMSMMNINGNTYYQAAGSTSQVIRGTGLYATNADELYTAVTTTDKNPVAVAWVNADGTIENATITVINEDSADDPWN